MRHRPTTLMVALPLVALKSTGVSASTLRRLAVLWLLVACLPATVTTAVAQSTVERIMLPDSAGVASPGFRAFYWPDLNRTYFGGDAGIGVLEGPLGRRVRRIDENGMLNSEDRLYADTAARRLVHATGYDTLTYIIDPDADTVVAAVRIPNYAVGRTMAAEDACVDVRNHRLFVGYQMTAGGPDGIAVYDLVTGALIDTVDSGGGERLHDRHRISVGPGSCEFSDDSLGGPA